ncbi:MAG: nitrilase-related carbon-nitrogen hydrolase [Runella sp.]
MRYKALALQVTCQTVNVCPDREAADAVMSQTLDRLEKQIAASMAFIGKDVKLVVLPEYFLTGFPMGESIEAWKAKACLDMQGKEYDRMSAIAQKLGVYLSGNVYENDPHFPNLYFQTSFVISPSGEVILRYRRLNSMFAPTPHDVWDKYLGIYGYEAVFPVAQTDIGRLACIASEEILYPEIARCLAMRGAEVFCHSSSEVGSNLLTPKNVAKLARAIENMAYVVSANSAGMAEIPIPFASTDGASKIINYEGLVLAEAGYGESMVANATIDLPALRAHRQRPAMSNFLARQRFELYAESYAQHHFYPVNSLAHQKAERAHFVQTQRQVIEQLTLKGVIQH